MAAKIFKKKSIKLSYQVIGDKVTNCGHDFLGMEIKGLHEKFKMAENRM
jgi:hypothetical protein